MAKKKLESKIISYGIYTKFDSGSKDLPEILEFTEKMPAKIGIEFGYILQIKKGRGEKLSFRIEHPPFRNSNGDIAPPFVGEFYVKHSHFEFFLGDTIWEPIENKIGPWKLTIFWNDKVIAEKTFQIVADD